MTLLKQVSKNWPSFTKRNGYEREIEKEQDDVWKREISCRIGRKRDVLKMW